MESNKYAGKKCFVIMPFGKKDVIDNKGNVLDTVDFDFVYHELIRNLSKSLTSNAKDVTKSLNRDRSIKKCSREFLKPMWRLLILRL